MSILWSKPAGYRVLALTGSACLGFFISQLVSNHQKPTASPEDILAKLESERQNTTFKYWDLEQSKNNQAKIK